MLNFILVFVSIKSPFSFLRYLSLKKKFLVGWQVVSSSTQRVHWISELTFVLDASFMGSTIPMVMCTHHLFFFNLTCYNCHVQWNVLIPPLVWDNFILLKDKIIQLLKRMITEYTLNGFLQDLALSGTNWLNSSVLGHGPPLLLLLLDVSAYPLEASALYNISLLTDMVFIS